MPMYEYECVECEAVTEVLRPMSQADAPIDCEQCGSEKTKRKQSVFAAGTSDSQAPAMPLAAPCNTCGNAMGSCQMNQRASS